MAGFDAHSLASSLGWVGAYRHILAGERDVVWKQAVRRVRFDGRGEEGVCEIVLEDGEVVVPEQMPEEREIFDSDEAEGLAD